VVLIDLSLSKDQIWSLTSFLATQFFTKFNYWELLTYMCLRAQVN